MKLDKHFFMQAVPGVSFSGHNNPEFTNFVIDSRTAENGSTFIALEGDNVDGHDFIKDAFENGAKNFIINENKKDALKVLSSQAMRECGVALVASVQDALCSLAAAWRKCFTCPIIAITGSVGKTSTKEMLATIIRLSGKCCLSSQGNYNTRIGSSLTLLKLRPEHECAILELGINKRGELAEMARIVNPTFAVITSIAHSHMEGLGSLSDIATEKRDIFSAFKEDSIGFINGDQSIISSVSYSHPVVKFGFKTANPIQARRVQVAGSSLSFVLKLYDKRYAITLPTVHTGRVLNALASASVAHFLEIDHEHIVKGVMQAPVVPGRFEPCRVAGGGLVINDCYNANPESMKEALIAFERLESTGKKIAILGDMLELGMNAVFWHRQLGRVLRKVPSLDKIIFVGNLIKGAEETMPRSIDYVIVATWQEALKELEKYRKSQDAILVKASHGMGLSNLVDTIV